MTRRKQQDVINVHNFSDYVCLQLRLDSFLEIIGLEDDGYDDEEMERDLHL